jgi:hypothetical protein
VTGPLWDVQPCGLLCSAFAALIGRTLSEVWLSSMENVPITAEFAHAAASLIWGNNPGTMLCGDNPAFRLTIQSMVRPPRRCQCDHAQLPLPCVCLLSLQVSVLEIEDDLASASSGVLVRRTDAREWLLDNIAALFKLTAGQACPKESKHDIVDLDAAPVEEKKRSFLPSLFGKKKSSSSAK